MVLITKVLETCLYATDLVAAEKFYVNVMGLEVCGREEGRHVFFRLRDTMFLVFDSSRTKGPGGEVGGVRVPSHGADGAGHVAFRVRDNELPYWRSRLSEHGIEIEAEIAWPAGGNSIYLRDPSGNSVELATPQVWHIPES